MVIERRYQTDNWAHYFFFHADWTTMCAPRRPKIAPKSTMCVPRKTKTTPESTRRVIHRYEKLRVKNV